MKASDFWAGNAIILGIWEAAAIKTGRVPTISTTVARARQRWPYRTTAFLIAWSTGLVAYLHTKKLDD